MEALKGIVIIQGLVFIGAFDDHIEVPDLEIPFLRLCGGRGGIPLLRVLRCLPLGIVLLELEVGLVVVVQCYQIPAALQKAAHFVCQSVIHNGPLLGPANKGLVWAAAVVTGAVIGDPGLHRHVSPGGIVREVVKGEVVTGGDLGGLVAAVVLPGGVGLEVADLRQPVLLLLELELQLFDRQPLLFQGQLRQCGVVGQQNIPFFHRIPLGDVNFRDFLGVADHHRLHIVRLDPAAGLLGVAPVIRHTRNVNAVDIDGFSLGLVLLHHEDPHAHRCRCHSRHRGNEPFGKLLGERLGKLPGLLDF